MSWKLLPPLGSALLRPRRLLSSHPGQGQGGASSSSEFHKGLIRPPASHSHIIRGARTLFGGQNTHLHAYHAPQKGNPAGCFYKLGLVPRQWGWGGGGGDLKMSPELSVAGLLQSLGVCSRRWFFVHTFNKEIQRTECLCATLCHKVSNSLKSACATAILISAASPKSGQADKIFSPLNRK